MYGHTLASDFGPPSPERTLRVARLWQDHAFSNLLATLPDEPDSPEIDGEASEEFRARLVEALVWPITLTELYDPPATASRRGEGTASKSRSRIV